MTHTAISIETSTGAAPDSATSRGIFRLLALLPVHAVVWTLAAWLSRGNLDTPGDMAENYVWGIEWQGGYAKHPPLFGWITAAWFSIAPHTDLAYFGLSALNTLIGLLGIVALARRFLPWRLAIVAGLAMAVSPLYTNLAIKFNANAVLLSVWPWTAYFFVRFMQSGARRWAFALGVFATTAFGLLLGQLDKLTLSTLRPLEEFGCYAVAATVSGGIGRLVQPMFNAVYPRLSRLASNGRRQELSQLYHLASQIVAVALAAMAGVICAYPGSVLLLWTGNAEVASRTAVPLALLFAGTAINGIMNLPYALQLAHGWTRLATSLEPAR